MERPSTMQINLNFSPDILKNNIFIISFLLKCIESKMKNKEMFIFTLLRGAFPVTSNKEVTLYKIQIHLFLCRRKKTVTAGRNRRFLIKMIFN